VSLPEGKELWGLTVNEAFNQGVPVVTTEAVGAAAGGLVQDGLTGRIVPERNSAALARVLDELLNDEAQRNRLSSEARRRVKMWSNEAMVEAFCAAIEYARRPRETAIR
jgi:glycosyltransferase involved in cell wall biosynthesis